MNSTPIYTVLGTTDDHTACELCGRDDLKSTVALRDNQTGETVYYGSDCGARATGWTTREITTAAKSADDKRRASEQAQRDAANAERTKRWEDWLESQTGHRSPADALPLLGGFVAARAAYNEATN